MNEIKLGGLSQEQVQELIPENTILLGYRGSIAHGTYVSGETDDKDVIGVCIPELSVYFGLSSFEQQERQIEPWDSVVYEIRKYFRLLLRANPNVLGLLWLEPKNYIHISPQGQEIIDHRKLFVSKQIYHSFTGYAYSQLKRMTHFGDSRFKTAYMGEKRKAFVERHGYDTKNAAHLIRLLRMGIEFLNEGELHVRREDASQLIDIKQGKWSLDRVQQEADHLFRRAEAAYDSCKLPNKPRFRAIEHLLITILSGFHGIE